MLKIGYFADGLWAHQALGKIELDKEIAIDFICVRYDTPDQYLVNYAKEHNIECFIYPDINDRNFIARIKEYHTDLFVSMSFNQIFRKEIINLPSLKTINCHAGKLPFYRGRNILNWALINDEKEFGITVHYIDEGIDTGDIILQKVYPITDEDTYATLLEKAHHYCADVLYEALYQIKMDQVHVIKQKSIHEVGFYCGMRKAGDEKICWNQTSRELFNFIRAICRPGPMATSQINGTTIKINRAKMIRNAVNYIGTVGQVVGKTANGFIVKTQDNTLEITEFEYDGKIRIGDRLK